MQAPPTTLPQVLPKQTQDDVLGKDQECFAKGGLDDHDEFTRKTQSLGQLLGGRPWPLCQEGVSCTLAGRNSDMSPPLPLGTKTLPN